jgi:sulfur carrier protein
VDAEACASRAQVAILLNGEPASFPRGLTISGLIAHLGLPEEGVAVAVGSRVVPRGEHDSCRLEAGQKVELIQAVGGG